MKFLISPINIKSQHMAGKTIIKNIFIYFKFYSIPSQKIYVKNMDTVHSSSISLGGTLYLISKNKKLCIFLIQIFTQIVYLTNEYFPKRNSLPRRPSLYTCYNILERSSAKQPPLCISCYSAIVRIFYAILDILRMYSHCRKGN